MHMCKVTYNSCHCSEIVLSSHNSNVKPIDDVFPVTLSVSTEVVIVRFEVRLFGAHCHHIINSISEKRLAYQSFVTDSHTKRAQRHIGI